MKKRDLTRRLAELGFWADGGTKHEKWTNGEFTTMVPRSREINEHTARGIIADCEQAKSAKDERGPKEKDDAKNTSKSD